MPLCASVEMPVSIRHCFYWLWTLLEMFYVDVNTYCEKYILYDFIPETYRFKSKPLCKRMHHKDKFKY